MCASSFARAALVNTSEPASDPEELSLPPAIVRLPMPMPVAMVAPRPHARTRGVTIHLGADLGLGPSPRALTAGLFGGLSYMFKPKWSAGLNLAWDTGFSAVERTAAPIAVRTARLEAYGAFRPRSHLELRLAAGVLGVHAAAAGLSVDTPCWNVVPELGAAGLVRAAQLGPLDLWLAGSVRSGFSNVDACTPISVNSYIPFSLSTTSGSLGFEGSFGL